MIAPFAGEKMNYKVSTATYMSFIIVLQAVIVSAVLNAEDKNGKNKED